MNVDRCAGTHPDAPIKLSKTLIDWAGHIFVMQNRHAEEVMKLSPEAKNKTHVLDVLDIYDRDDSELKRILKEKLCINFPQLSRMWM